MFIVISNKKNINFTFIFLVCLAIYMIVITKPNFNNNFGKIQNINSNSTRCLLDFSNNSENCISEVQTNINFESENIIMNQPEIQTMPPNSEEKKPEIQALSPDSGKKNTTKTEHKTCNNKQKIRNKNIKTVNSTKKSENINSESTNLIEIKPRIISKQITDSNGIIRNYSKIIVGSATAYTASKGAITSLGYTPKSGITAAVNPKNIPYGTEILIDLGDKKINLKAQDTGSALRRGSCAVDIFMDNTKKCLEFGRKNVKIYCLTKI
ncbi:MAG: 3D domain-containing protein [Candidatus Improbicoccus devescovinae]|nr:MAG: 3D domain-containing protein [Candidatus Improbicoccus devescovinae]